MVEVTRNRHFPGRRRWLGLLALILVLPAGAGLAWWTAVRADHEMRAELLRQTRLVAQAVHLDDIRALSATGADLDRPEYQRLKKQLATVRSIDRQCRFVYLLGRRADGTVFFFVDSEPSISKDYSPPGQIYEEVTPENRRQFDTRAALVEGPVSDRWGVWVSALVPLLDPSTGTLIAVLGMDVDASTWQWEVAARVALPIGLILVLFIVAAALISVRRAVVSPQPVLRRLLLPLAAMVVLLILGAGGILWQQQRQQLTREIAADLADAVGDLRVALDQEANYLAASAKPIAADPAVQQALRAGDADRLLADWRPMFETLHREQRLTHLSFFDQYRVCLLRVHKPELRGDRIDRFTTREAERTGKTAAGLELGALDIYTLRVVQPVFAEGRRVGFVELGQEIENIVQSLRLRSSNQLAVVIRKAFLNRPAWEEGMRMLGREPEWDRLPHNVVIYSSQGRLPDAFAAWADLTADAVPGGPNRVVAFDQKAWQMAALPLQNTTGQTVGELLVLRDITAEKAAFGHLLILGGSAGAVLLTLLLGFIYVLLRRTNAGILAQQAALGASAAQQRAILQTAMDGFWMADPQGRLLEVNDTYSRMSGYSVPELLAMRISDLEVVETEADAAAHIQRIQDQGEDRFESRHRRKDGSVFEVEVSVQYRPRENRLVTFIHDITVRKQAEEKQRESNLRFHQLVDNIHQVFWMADMNSGQVIYVSPAFEGIWGRSCTSLYLDPQVWLTAIHPEDRGRVEALLAEQVSGGYHVEYRVVRPDGSVRWLTDHAFPVRDAAGRIYRLAGVAEDITERVQARQELETYQRKLRSLAHQLLMVEERERRHLARNLHDGPCQVLAVTRMKLDELEESAPPAQLRQALHDIGIMLGQSIQEMRSLMLELSPPVLHELGLAAAARWLADDLLERYQLQVRVTEDGSPQPLDPQIANVLFRSLRELLLNVVKHARTREARVTLRHAPEGLSLVVADQGAGFVTSPTISSSDGLRKSSGFGLFSIHEWLSHLGGSLKVHSRPQKGTTVTIRLPAQVVYKEARSSCEHPHPAG